MYRITADFYTSDRRNCHPDYVDYSENKKLLSTYNTQTLFHTRVPAV